MPQPKLTSITIGRLCRSFSKCEGDFGKSYGPLVNDFIHAVTEYLWDFREFGRPGTPTYAPSAVAVAMDPTLVNLQEMHMDVETRGKSW